MSDELIFFYFFWNFQIEAEKLALQKALLYFENLHGRPKTRQDRLVMRPLYDRYRSVKRLLKFDNYQNEELMNQSMTRERDLNFNHANNHNYNNNKIYEYGSDTVTNYDTINSNTKLLTFDIQNSSSSSIDYAQSCYPNPHMHNLSINQNYKISSSGGGNNNNNNNGAKVIGYSSLSTGLIENSSNLLENNVHNQMNTGHLFNSHHAHIDNSNVNFYPRNTGNLNIDGRFNSIKKAAILDQHQYNSSGLDLSKIRKDGLDLVNIQPELTISSSLPKKQSKVKPSKLDNNEWCM